MFTFLVYLQGEEDETWDNNRNMTLENITTSDYKTALTLNDITVRVDAGQLLAVIGPVGAGKVST